MSEDTTFIPSEDQSEDEELLFDTKKYQEDLYNNFEDLMIDFAQHHPDELQKSIENTVSAIKNGTFSISLYDALKSVLYMALLPSKEYTDYKDCFLTFLTLKSYLNYADKNEAEDLRSRLMTYFNEFYDIAADDLQAVADKYLPSITYNKSTSLSLSNDKVTRTIFEKKTGSEEDCITKINVAPKRKKPVEIIEEVSMTLENGQTLPNNLSPYDLLVFDGVCTLYQNGYDIFTSEQLFEVIAGKKSRSAQSKAAVTQSLNKMKRSTISLDWTDQAKMLGLPMQNDDYLITDSYILPIERISAKINGAVVPDAWHLIQSPKLYDYTRKVKQIITVDKKLLVLPSISNTETNLVIKTYLLKRIETMYNDPNKSKTIRYEILYNHANASDKISKQRLRNDVDSMLDDWCKMGYIKAFKRKKEGRSFSGVEIELLGKNKFKSTK